MTDAAESRDDEEGSFDDYFSEFTNTEKEDDESPDDSKQEEDASSENQEIDEKEQLRQERDALKKERDELDHAFKSQVGRVSALTKKINEGQVQQPEPDEDLKSVLEDYPEIAGPIVKFLEKKYGAINQEIEQRFAPIQQQEQSRYLESQIAWMDANHPGWNNTINSPEYNEWIKQQPEMIQAMDNSQHAKDVSFLLNSFNATKQNKASDIVQRRQQKLAANETIPSKGESKKSVAPDDFEEAWKYYAKRSS